MSVSRRAKKTWCVYTMEHDSAVKRTKGRRWRQHGRRWRLSQSE